MFVLLLKYIKPIEEVEKQFTNNNYNMQLRLCSKV